MSADPNRALWKLDQMMADISATSKWQPLTGTIEQQGEEIIRRCAERERLLAQRAVEAERDGDEQCCWMCMAARAENKRLRDKVAADLAAGKERETR